MLRALLRREPVAADPPRVDASRCLRARFRRTSCRRCVDACPRGAVALGAGTPLVAADACLGCRRCEASCPAGALGDPQELGRAIDALARRARPVLGCRAPGVEAHGRVACLGQLDPEALFALAASFPAGLTLNVIHCESCPEAAVVPALRRSLGPLATAPELAARLRLARSREALAFEPDGLSRRELFTVFRRRAARVAPPAGVPWGATEAAPAPDAATCLPAGRRALLRVFPHLSPALRAAAEASFFPALAFSAACRSCTACAGVCPTGALTTDPGEPPRPVFEARTCTGCGLCVEVCRRGAPALSPPRAARPAGTTRA